jgi:hypothetical protein
VDATSSFRSIEFVVSTYQEFKDRKKIKFTSDLENATPPVGTDP